MRSLGHILHLWLKKQEMKIALCSKVIVEIEDINIYA